MSAAAPSSIGPRRRSIPPSRSSRPSFTRPSSKLTWRRIGDRVGDQHGIGDPVDGEVAPRGQGADDAREHRCQQLGAVDRQLGPLSLLRLDLDFVSRGLRTATPQRHAHHDLGAPIDAAGDREAARKRGDQRETQAQAVAVAVRLWADSRTFVANHDGQSFRVGPRLDAERPGLAPIGMQDDVHAGLGDDGLQIGQPGLVHADLLGQPSEGMANHSHVLGLGR